MENLTKIGDSEQLNDTDAESTILRMKTIFPRQGFPEVVISDNGPQHASKEFNEFSKSWNFHHYTSSPHHPKGNGTAEADELASPNEKLNSRRTRTVIPMKSELL